MTCPEQPTRLQFAQYGARLDAGRRNHSTFSSDCGPCSTRPKSNPISIGCICPRALDLHLLSLEGRPAISNRQFGPCKLRPVAGGGAMEARCASGSEPQSLNAQLKKFTAARHLDYLRLPLHPTYCC